MMTNKQKINAIIELLNALIVGVDTPTKIVTYCRRFRTTLMKWQADLTAEQTAINFDVTTHGATDANGNEIADVYTV